MFSVVFARLLIATDMGLGKVSGPLPTIAIRLGDPVKTTKSFTFFVSLYVLIRRND
jgi:hypothetical protein